MTSRTEQVYDTLVLHNPKLVLVVLLSILVFFGYHTKDFKLDASADSLLLEDDSDLNLFRKIHERYPSGDLLVVTYTPDNDLFSDQALEPLKRLRGELKEVTSVNTVFTILDAPSINELGCIASGNGRQYTEPGETRHRPDQGKGRAD